MPVGVDGQIKSIRDRDGSIARPASDEELAALHEDIVDYGHASGSADLSAGIEVAIDASNWPAEKATVLVDPGTGSAEVAIDYENADGETVISRGPADDQQYSGEAGEQVYLTASVAAPHMTVRIDGDSEGAFSVQVI